MNVRVGVIGIAGLLTMSACSLFSGPSDATIEELARQSMLATLGDAGPDPVARKALEEAVAKATIEKKGLCNNEKPEIYACMVNVTMTLPGKSTEEVQTFVVEATRTPQGDWIVAD